MITRLDPIGSASAGANEGAEDSVRYQSGKERFLSEQKRAMGVPEREPVLSLSALLIGD